MIENDDFIRIRKLMLEVAYNSGKGHIGSALSVLDLCFLIGKKMKGIGTGLENRDRFVLSKGHSALAWYITLFELGIINRETLNTYGKDDTFLGTHPDPNLNGVDFLTGSLGQGISYGLGSAFASKLTKDNWKTYVLLSDSELNEGSTLESFAIAGHHKLNNLIVILDKNNQQATGYTKDILKFDDEKNLLDYFEWDTFEINGHDHKEIELVLDKSILSKRPVFIIANTILGKGISYMEKKIEWHYRYLDDELYQKAMMELNKK